MPFRPYPQPGTRLRAQGAAEWLTGDVELRPGVGTTPRNHASDPALIVDAPAVDKDAPAGLFVPSLSGYPAAGVTLRMTDVTRYLLMLEAIILGTTPGAADSSNCYGIRVAGATSGQQDLRLSSNVREHSWAGDDVGEVGAQEQIGAQPPRNKAIVSFFEATADLTVSRIRLRTQTTVDTDDAWEPGESRRFVITNADLTAYLGVTNYSDADWMVADQPVTLDLTESIDIPQGTVFGVGAELEHTSEGDGARPAFSNGSDVLTGSVSGELGPGGTSLGYLPDTVGAGSCSLVDRRAELSWHGVVNQRLTMGLLGAPGGVLIGGNVELDVVTFGTPPAHPTDVNVRFQWATAAP